MTAIWKTISRCCSGCDRRGVSFPQAALATTAMLLLPVLAGADEIPPGGTNFGAAVVDQADWRGNVVFEKSAPASGPGAKSGEHPAAGACQPPRSGQGTSGRPVAPGAPGTVGLPSTGSADNTEAAVSAPEDDFTRLREQPGESRPASVVNLDDVLLVPGTTGAPESRRSAASPAETGPASGQMRTRHAGDLLSGRQSSGLLHAPADVAPAFGSIPDIPPGTLFRAGGRRWQVLGRAGDVLVIRERSTGRTVRLLPVPGSGGRRYRLPPQVTGKRGGTKKPPSGEEPDAVLPLPGQIPPPRGALPPPAVR